jgi:hypothetical protein
MTSYLYSITKAHPISVKILVHHELRFQLEEVSLYHIHMHRVFLLTHFSGYGIRRCETKRKHGRKRKGHWKSASVSNNYGARQQVAASRLLLFRDGKLPVGETTNGIPHDDKAALGKAIPDR